MGQAQANPLLPKIPWQAAIETRLEDVTSPSDLLRQMRAQPGIMKAS